MKPTNEQCLERVSALADAAIRRYTEGDMDEAECAAYEAGRYGIAVPETIRENEFLKHAFERGTADAPQDASDLARADVIAEAGFDPSRPSRKSSSPSPF